jgi:hyperosmotically inducible protein
MRTRSLPIMAAVWLGVLMIPLAGCDRDVNAVHADRDAQGNTTVHVDGKQVDQNIDQANKDFKAAGEQIKEGASEAGAALQRGAEKAQEKIGPVVNEVMDNATITSKVKAKLATDPAINALYIDVDTSNGRVTLSGKVALAGQREAAEKIARRTDGVKDVVNQIQVIGEPATAPPVGQ